MDDIKKLLALDLAKNYSSETITADEYFDAIQAFEKSGNKVKKIGTSLFLMIEKTDGVEWHIVDGESWTTKMKNVRDFFVYLSNAGIKKAETYFDDVKLSIVLKRLGFSFSVVETNEGKYHKYNAKVVIA